MIQHICIACTNGENWDLNPQTNCAGEYLFWTLQASGYPEHGPDKVSIATATWLAAKQLKWHQGAV